VVVLAESSIASSEVIIVMSFADRDELKDAYNTFCRVCKDKGFPAYKVDHHIDTKQRIVPTIFDSIRRCAFIVADVTDARSNVYYELGYARALGKTVIQTAHDGINLPFDVYDVPTLFWDCQDTLEQKLAPAIEDVTLTSAR
jgi:nucleoside 2-deoxyribosyltransferase